MQQRRIPGNPQKDRSYSSFVKVQARPNPSLSNLVDFFAQYPRSGWPARKDCRIVALDFRQGVHLPDTHDVRPDQLSSWLRVSHSLRVDSVSNHEARAERVLLGRIFIIEDLTPMLIEELGSYLDIDPLFFASHLHAPSFDMGTQLPDSATLPSRYKPQKFTNIHYHRTIVFDSDSLPSGTLIRDTNVPRKVAVLPQIKSTRIGLAQQCVSIYKPQVSGGFWIGTCSHHKKIFKLLTNMKGVILVDPPITETFTFKDKGPSKAHSLTVSSELYMKGYEDFLDPPSYHALSTNWSGPNRKSLFDDLIYYWAAASPPGFCAKDACLLNLAYFPLKIAAGEWVKYVAVMSSSIKEYEYSNKEKPVFLQELEKLDTDLRALQSWRRRTMSTKQKLQSILRLLKFHQHRASAEEAVGSLMEDYQYIERNVSDCGARLESMLPTVTSLVQIVDSRRSFAETANVSRLTVLALIFVPLSFVASLFSMNQDLGPGGNHFWLYFAVAIPVTIVVVLLARPPWKAIRRGGRSLLKGENTAVEVGGKARQGTKTFSSVGDEEQLKSRYVP